MSALATALVDSGYEAVEVLGRSYVRIAGLVAPYDEWEPIGSFAESFAPGVFTESLAPQPDVPLLSFHSHDQPALGLAVAWQEENFGLYAVFKIAMHAAAQMASSYADEGLMNGLSVGFVPITSRWSYAGEYAPERGMSHMDKVVRVKARLAEVSLVNAGAYQSARVTSVESEAVDTASARASRALVRQPVLPANYIPPTSNHQTFEPAPADDTAVITPPAEIDQTSSLPDVVAYVLWLAARVGTLEGVSQNIVAALTPPSPAGGVAPPSQALLP